MYIAQELIIPKSQNKKNKKFSSFGKSMETAGNT